jgi:hypothetical protein
MESPRVPDELMGGLALLPELFRASAKWRGLSREDIDEITALVPGEILQRLCFLDRLTSLWRYEYGQPFDIGGGQILSGTNVFQEVDRLFEVLACAQNRLRPEKLSEYLKRLADPIKHADMLAEFAPILRLPLSVETNYEVSGYGEGNLTVDWVIRSEIPVLIEVKKRAVDLIQSLERFQAGARDPDGKVPAPIHDISLLFRSVESKFGRHRPAEMIQVVWVVTYVRQEETELQSAFAKLDPSRIHLAIIGDWEDDVYVLAHDPSIKEHVLNLLGLRESRRAVFQRDRSRD